jgi:tetratricopeptide (TPR) repeat protein
MNARRAFIVLAFFGMAACAGFEAAGEFTRGRQALMRGDADALGYFQRVASSDPKYVVTSGPLTESIWTYIGRVHYQAGKYPEAREALEKALAQSPGDHMGRLYLGLTLARLPAPKSTALSAQDISFALREGVEGERVAALARERGVSFDVNREAESQLRKAGADTRLIDEIKKLRASSAKTESNPARALKELTAALTGLRDDLNAFLSNSLQGRFWDPGSVLRTDLKTGLGLLAAREPDWNKIISNGEGLGQKFEEEIDRARRDEADSLRRERSR